MVQIIADPYNFVFAVHGDRGMLCYYCCLEKELFLYFPGSHRWVAYALNGFSKYYCSFAKELVTSKFGRYTVCNFNCRGNLCSWDEQGLNDMMLFSKLSWSTVWRR